MPYLISSFTGCTKDQYSNITRGGLLSLKMVIKIWNSITSGKLSSN